MDIIITVAAFAFIIAACMVMGYRSNRNDDIHGVPVWVPIRDMVTGARPYNGPERRRNAR